MKTHKTPKYDALQQVFGFPSNQAFELYDELCSYIEEGGDIEDFDAGLIYTSDQADFFRAFPQDCEEALKALGGSRIADAINFARYQLALKLYHALDFIEVEDEEEEEEAE